MCLSTEPVQRPNKKCEVGCEVLNVGDQNIDNIKENLLKKVKAMQGKNSINSIFKITAFLFSILKR